MPFPVKIAGSRSGKSFYPKQHIFCFVYYVDESLHIRSETINFFVVKDSVSEIRIF